jgi:hypothetical protein
MRKPLSAIVLVALSSCAAPPPAETPPQAPVLAPAAPATAAPTTATLLSRDEVNRTAVRLNLPLFWAADRNGNGKMDPDEVASLLFYPSAEVWVRDGAFTPAFATALSAIERTAHGAAPPGSDDESTRRRLVLEDLDSGKPTLVYSDLRKDTEEQKKLVRHMLTASALIDQLHAAQLGITQLAAKVPTDDLASQSLFRRDWGPKCVDPKTEDNPLCSAIAGSPKPLVDIYPAQLQKNDHFCAELEKLPDAKKLLDPFVVVRKEGEKLVIVPYSEAYKDTMSKVAAELEAAANDLADPHEAPLKAYLALAAKSFKDNDWRPADEAWAKMNAENSAFYVRVAPDETYWEPCSQKAGFHLTFARINTDSLAWQKKLVPVQQEMEQTLAKVIGKPYTARKVSFHLPDFIDIITNAGNDRDALGATIGQSLPNWGPVANEGRGRTVAMSNLFTDPDSRAARRRQAESLLDKATIAAYADSAVPGLLSTILHEATHNLGPSHEYKFQSKKDTQWFGGELASMLEELKAQSGTLFFIDDLRKHGIISDELAAETYVDSIVWGFGHVARGMRTPTGKAKPYSQLAAIQLGFLMDEGAVVFHADAPAANGTDKGAFEIVVGKMPNAAAKLMARVGAIKASGNRADAEALVKKYVDGPTVPQSIIVERLTRYPKQSLVYAVDL